MRNAQLLKKVTTQLYILTSPFHLNILYLCIKGRSRMCGVSVFEYGMLSSSARWQMAVLYFSVPTPTYPPVS